MDEKLVINGGKRLVGTTTVGGAKNAAVAILPATILAQDVCVIENLPCIDDVRILLKILQKLGADVKFDKTTGTARIDTSTINTSEVMMELAKKLRASYYLVGAMLARFGKAQVFLPGGCTIGQRPIDLHIKGLKALGADVSTEFGAIAAVTEGLHGGEVYLDQVSVGATINIMLAAVKAPGSTTIVNAAKEPHVVDVANFLNCMGANIKGAGTDTVHIKGVEALHGCTYSVIPDQIEAGTLMIAAAATRGDVLIQNLIPTHMEALSAKLVEMGVSVTTEGYDAIRVKMDERPKHVNIKTLPYPGFPTDLQQPATVLLTTAEGTSMIIENIFESRFKHIDEIRKMGASVTIDDRVAVVEGVERLTGADVRATDLRAGAALIIAGLMAEGTTCISNVKYIDRGYDHIENKLIALGADIKRVIETPPDDSELDLELD